MKPKKAPARSQQGLTRCAEAVEADHRRDKEKQQLAALQRSPEFYKGSMKVPGEFCRKGRVCVWWGAWGKEFRRGLDGLGLSLVGSNHVSVLSQAVSGTAIPGSVKSLKP